MSKRSKLLFGVLAGYVAIMFIVVAIFGATRRDNEEFAPQNEFKLDTWFSLGPLDFNKAIFYVLAAGLLTVGTMLYIANRMQARPNRVQTAVETLYALMRDNITRGNMDDKMAAKWFPFIGALFLFIWFSNLIGYIPLPTNTEHPFTLFGIEIPAFAIYAATANVSIPLVLALVVFVAYNLEGIRAKGVGGYLKSLVPQGVKGPMAGFIFVLEFVSNFMRLISLSVRLFANILAGHLIILFMAGGLAVLLGIEVLGVFTLPFGILLFMFEVGWSPRCRPSSSPPCLPSTSAAPSPTTTKEHAQWISCCPSSPSSPRRTPALTRARPSRSASEVDSARWAPASASAPSSARSSSRSPGSPRCATRSRRSSGSASRSPRPASSTGWSRA
jgi:F-type H+-transporting ATPase subunit a